MSVANLIKIKIIYWFCLLYKWCHLFDVDTVSTESGVTELAIVARLDKTSTLVATLHLKIRSNQTRHDQLGLTRPDQPHPSPSDTLGSLRLWSLKKEGTMCSWTSIPRRFFRSQSKGGEGVLLMSPGFSLDWVPDTPTFIKCTSALSQVSWATKVLPLSLPDSTYIESTSWGSSKEALHKVHQQSLSSQKLMINCTLHPNSKFCWARD